MKTLNIISFLLLIFAFGCKKDPPVEPKDKYDPNVMPPLTHTGENTFGCYIEFPSSDTTGEPVKELFVANNGSNGWSLPAISGSFDESTNFLKMQGSREVLRDSNIVKGDNIRLRCIADSGVGSYSLYFETDHYLGYTSHYFERCKYYHDLNNRGTCEVTYLDTEKNIISGRFEMTLINPDCPEDTLMKITDGRFDFRY